MARLASSAAARLVGIRLGLFEFGDQAVLFRLGVKRAERGRVEASRQRDEVDFGSADESGRRQHGRIAPCIEPHADDRCAQRHDGRVDGVRDGSRRHCVHRADQQQDGEQESARLRLGDADENERDGCPGEAEQQFGGDEARAPGRHRLDLGLPEEHAGDEPGDADREGDSAGPDADRLRRRPERGHAGDGDADEKRPRGRGGAAFGEQPEKVALEGAVSFASGGQLFASDLNLLVEPAPFGRQATVRAAPALDHFGGDLTHFDDPRGDATDTAAVWPVKLNDRLTGPRQSKPARPVRKGLRSRGKPGVCASAHEKALRF